VSTQSLLFSSSWGFRPEAMKKVNERTRSLKKRKKAPPERCLLTSSFDLFLNYRAAV